MRKADVFIHGFHAGVLEEIRINLAYRYSYDQGYEGPPISRTMPLEMESRLFDRFPSFFEGLLPEGYNLEALLRTLKIDRGDLFGQLMAVGADTTGAVTVREIE